MKKPFMIASVLLLLTIIAISLSVQEEFNKSKLDDYWHQLEKDTRAMYGLVITKDEKLVYENYIDFSSRNDKTRNNNFTYFRMGSMFVFETIFGLKVVIFIVADNSELINNTKELFAVKKPTEPKLEKKLD